MSVWVIAWSDSPGRAPQIEVFTDEAEMLRRYVDLGNRVAKAYRGMFLPLPKEPA